MTNDDARGREDDPLHDAPAGTNADDPRRGAPGDGSAPATGVVATTSTTRTQVRERAARISARQKKMSMARTAVIGVVIIAALVAIAIVVTNIVTSAVNKPQVDPAGLDGDGIRVEASGVKLPSSAGNGTITSSTPPSASPAVSTVPNPNPVEVRIYVDYLSADSATFQKANARQLARLIGDGAVTVAYNPVATLASKSNGTKYSLRAAGAAACVASFAPDYFFAYNYELLAKQPALDSDGMTDDQLADLATAVGAGSPQGLRACITQGTFQPWVKLTTDKALSENLPGTQEKLADTPVILVNGVRYIGALDDPAELMQFIMAAESRAYYETPEPTATPEPSTEPTKKAAETPAAEPEPAQTPAE